MNRRVLLWFMLFSFSSSSFALEPEIHKSYTKQAFQVYRELCEQDATRHCLAAKEGDWIAQGTSDEDTTELWIRFTNWHFYDRLKENPSSWFGVRKESLNNIFAIRSEDMHASFESLASKEEAYTRAGRVLHYIQDMSVPSHVVPVYHGGKWGFGIFDQFDSYEFCHSLLALKGNDSSVYHNLKRVLPLKLLENAAKDTLAAVAMPISSEQSKVRTWDSFWCFSQDESRHCPKSGREGFGSYGVYGNSFGLSQNCTVVGIEDDFSVIEDCVDIDVSDDEYRAFYTMQFREIIKNSIRFFLYLEELPVDRS